MLSGMGMKSVMCSALRLLELLAMASALIVTDGLEIAADYVSVDQLLSRHCYNIKALCDQCYSRHLSCGTPISNS